MLTELECKEKLEIGMVILLLKHKICSVFLMVGFSFQNYDPAFIESLVKLQSSRLDEQRCILPNPMQKVLFKFDFFMSIYYLLFSPHMIVSR